MSDISSPPVSPLPEAGHDPDEPGYATYQDEDPPSAPIGNPTADPEDDDDNDSVLSDIDEAQFEDFDPANIAIEDRPAIAVDEDNVRLLGRHKRKRDDADADGEGKKKKKKEGRREKPKKIRKRKDSDDDDFSGGQEIEGKRRRKAKAVSEGGVPGERRREKTKARATTPENEEHLDPEERTIPCIRASWEMILTPLYTGRRRALDRAMDAALKNPSKRRRRVDGIVCLPGSNF